MEVWLSSALGFDCFHGRARIYGSGLKPISWVSYRDVAEFCIAPVLRSLAGRSVLEVGGPEALSPLEVVTIFEEESGRRFEVETIPETKLREQLDSAKDPLDQSFAGLMLRGCVSRSPGLFGSAPASSESCQPAKAGFAESMSGFSRANSALCAGLLCDCSFPAASVRMDESWPMTPWGSGCPRPTTRSGIPKISVKSATG
jgi:hypothetical protein